MLNLSRVINVFLITVVLLASDKVMSSENLSYNNWALQLAWGQGQSRWELSGGREKIEPDSWRLSIIQSNILNVNLGNSIPLQMDFDISAYHWKDPWNKRDISVLSFVPMFRTYWQFEHISVFIGAGIGLARLDSDVWMDRMLGSKTQFEDKLEIGFRLNRHQVSFNLSHFSNANLADINHGANVYQLNYAVYF